MSEFAGETWGEKKHYKALTGLSVEWAFLFAVLFVIISDFLFSGEV